MTEDYNSPASHRRKISDPLSRLSDMSSGSSFNSVGSSNPGSPRLLPRRARQNYAPSPSVTKSPILGSSNSTTVSSPFCSGFVGKQHARPSSNSSLAMMDFEGDDFLSGIDSGVSGNFSTDSGHFNHSGHWDKSLSPGKGSPRMGQSKGKSDINWQEKCLGLQLELHRFKHQASQVKDILQDKLAELEQRVLEAEERAVEAESKIRMMERRADWSVNSDGSNSQSSDAPETQKVITKLETQVEEQKRLRLQEAKQVEAKAALIKEWVANKLRGLEEQNQQLREQNDRCNQQIELLRNHLEQLRHMKPGVRTSLSLDVDKETLIPINIGSSMSQFVGKLWDRFRRALGGIVDGEENTNNYDSSKGGARTLDFVQSAIYNLRERNGSTFEEILDYLCSQYEVDEDTVRGRVMAALRRGVNIGVLEQEGSAYRLAKFREKKRHRWRKESTNSPDEKCLGYKNDYTEEYQNDEEDVDEVDVLERDDNY